MTQQRELTPRDAVSPETKRLRLAFHTAWVCRELAGSPEAHEWYRFAREAWHAHVIALDPEPTLAALAWWQSTPCGIPDAPGRCPCLPERGRT